MTGVATLGSMLARGGVVAPGVYDPLTAHIARRAGFEALYLSGAAVAYTKLGRPDIGLVSVTELVETATLIGDRVDCALIVDADTGFGNAVNVQRTVRALERAGAAAIQLEDQTFPKRCGHLSGKELVSTKEMAGKIAAAVDARHDRDTLVIARTDGIAVEGIERALDRAQAYADAGADVLFVEAPTSRDEMATIVTTLGGRCPLMANMVEGGRTPLQSATALHDIGFRLVIFPGGIVRALARSASDYYGSLKQHGENRPFQDRMFDFDGLNDVLGTEDLLRNAKRFE